MPTNKKTQCGGTNRDVVNKVCSYAPNPNSITTFTMKTCHFGGVSHFWSTHAHCINSEKIYCTQKQCATISEGITEMLTCVEFVLLGVGYNISQYRVASPCISIRILFHISFYTPNQTLNPSPSETSQPFPRCYGVMTFCHLFSSQIGCYMVVFIVKPVSS